MSEPREIDLDAARAERIAKNGKPPVLKFGGKRYTLPAELPADFLFEGASLDPKNPEAFLPILRAVLGDSLDEIRPKLSLDDIIVLAEKLPEKYGLTSGESSASGPSSSNASES